MRNIDDKALVHWLEIFVHVRRVDKQGLPIVRCPATLVDVAKNVHPRLDSPLHFVQQIQTARVAVAIKPVAVDCEIPASQRWTVGDENVRVIRNLFPLLQDCRTPRKIEGPISVKRCPRRSVYRQISADDASGIF